MLDRTGQTVRLREGAVPTVFAFTGDQKPLVVGRKAYERTGPLVIGRKAYERMAVAAVSAAKRMSTTTSNTAVVRAAAKVSQRNRAYGFQKMQLSNRMNGLAVSNMMFLNPNTNRISIVPVTSETELEIHRLVGDTDISSAAGRSAQMAGTSQTISADHSYSTCSNTTSLLSPSRGLMAIRAAAASADVPSESSNDDENVTMDSSHAIGDESGNVGGDSDISPTAGDESPCAARTPMASGADHCYSRDSVTTYNNMNDLQYLVKKREDVLVEKLERSRATMVAYRKKNKVLQQKVKRLQAHVNKLKQDLKTAKKNTPNVSLLKSAVITVHRNTPDAFRVLLPKDSNIGEDSATNFAAT